MSDGLIGAESGLKEGIKAGGAPERGGLLNVSSGREDDTGESSSCEMMWQRGTRIVLGLCFFALKRNQECAAGPASVHDFDNHGLISDVPASFTSVLNLVFSSYTII